jgi:hypothetical protein
MKQKKIATKVVNKIKYAAEDIVMRIYEPGLAINFACANNYHFHADSGQNICIGNFSHRKRRKGNVKYKFFSSFFALFINN